MALVILCASLFIGAGASLLSAPVYRAEARIEVDFSAEAPFGGSPADNRDRRRDETSFLQTQLEIIRSQSLAAEVANDLGSARDKASPALSVAIPDGSHIIEIAFTDDDPTLAAAAANAFASHLLRRRQVVRNHAYGEASSFLAAEVAQAKERLEVQNKNLVAFARAHDLVDIRSTDQPDPRRLPFDPGRRTCQVERSYGRCSRVPDPCAAAMVSHSQLPINYHG